MRAGHPRLWISDAAIYSPKKCLKDTFTSSMSGSSSVAMLNDEICLGVIVISSTSISDFLINVPLLEKHSAIATTVFIFWPLTLRIRPWISRYPCSRRMLLLSSLSLIFGLACSGLFDFTLKMNLNILPKIALDYRTRAVKPRIRQYSRLDWLMQPGSSITRMNPWACGM